MSNNIYHIDKTRVHASFDRTTSNYDATTILQAEVRNRMLERLDLVRIAPQRILDTDCDTEHTTATLSGHFKKSEVLALDIALGVGRFPEIVAKFG